MIRGWTVTFDGKEYRESDLTMAQAAYIISQAGGAWAELHPLTSPDHFVAIVVSFLIRDGVPEDEAIAKVGARLMTECLEMVAPGESVVDDH